MGTLEPHHALCDKSYTLGEMSADGKVLSNHTYKDGFSLLLCWDKR